MSVVVLGAGAGGLAVARALAALERPVVLVADGPIGDPTLPSKILIDLARDGRLQGSAVMSEVRRRLAANSASLHERLESTRCLRLLRGPVRFRDPYRLEVRGEETLESRQIVIATGSEPMMLDIPGLPADMTLTSESLLGLEHPPAHLAVVGSGVIALESACAFRRLGSRVTLIARSSRLLARESPAVSSALLGALGRQGIEVRLDVQPFLYAQGNLQLRPDGVVEDVDRVLLAVGRRPRSDELDLDRAGLDPGPIAVDEWGRTPIRGLYAIGDVTGMSRFSHTSRAQARRVVQHLTQTWGPGRPPTWVAPSVTFCEPEVASARLPGPESNRRTLSVALTELERGFADGFLELEVDKRSGRLLGATLVAPHASECIALLTLAMQEKIPLARLGRLVFPSPTVTEAVALLAERL